MTNEPMWREEFRKKFSGLHNVKSWAYEECDCNESTKKCIEKVEAFIDNQLTSLGQAMVDLFPSVGYEITAVEARNLLTAELSKRGILIPNV